MTQQSAATTVQHQQRQFAVEAQTLPSKIVIIGTFDPLKVTLATDTEIRVFSPEDVGDKAGFGFMAHRLAQAAFLGNQSAIPTFMIFQDEVAGTKAAGTSTFTGTTTAAGTVHQYINDIHIPVAIPKGTAAADVAIAVVAAVDAVLSGVGVPTTQAVDGIILTEIDWTAKTTGVYGNGIVIGYNWGEGQELPEGLSVVVVDMAGGAGLPDISTALTAMGSGDNQNQEGYTDLIHGYGIDTTTLDAISTYNGEGTTAIGNWAKTVARPFVSLKGDTVADTAGLTAAIAVGEARRALDRTNGMISFPGSPNHPDEAAAYAQSIISFNRNQKAYAATVDVQLPWIIPGVAADRWTDQKTNRDTAVQNGVSPSQFKGGVTVMLDILTFYHPVNIPYISNSYLYMRSIGLERNMMANIKQTFESPEYDNRVVVADKTVVTSTTDAIDINDVRGTLIALAREFARLAWIFQADFTIEKLKDDAAIVLKGDASGFDIIFSTILSGELRNVDVTLETDTSIAILTQ